MTQQVQRRKSESGFKLEMAIGRHILVREVYQPQLRCHACHPYSFFRLALNTSSPRSRWNLSISRDPLPVTTGLSPPPRLAHQAAAPLGGGATEDPIAEHGTGLLRDLAADADAGAAGAAGDERKSLSRRIELNLEESHIGS